MTGGHLTGGEGMTTHQYQRARHAGQKQQRRQAILDAAWAMYQTTPYEALAMASVAERVGLAKGTMYLYFAAKEELFLALAERELFGWLAEVDERLSEERPAWDIPAVVEIACGTLEAHPGLTRLLAILSTVLEQNIELETAIRFKRLLLAQMLRTGALLERRLPFLAPGDGLRTLTRCHALVVGLRHLADPAPIVREALRLPDLALFNIDFTGELRASMTLLLLGMRAAASTMPQSHESDKA
jgi:AcrR family transcriptional regulator